MRQACPIHMSDCLLWDFFPCQYLRVHQGACAPSSTQNCSWSLQDCNWWTEPSAELKCDLIHSSSSTCSSYRLCPPLCLLPPLFYCCNYSTLLVLQVLLGSRQGSLQLWNLHKGKLIYTFLGWNSPVTVLEQAPAVDVVAVGLEDGRTVLHNLKYDETVMTFMQVGSRVPEVWIFPRVWIEHTTVADVNVYKCCHKWKFAS